MADHEPPDEELAEMIHAATSLSELELFESYAERNFIIGLLISTKMTALENSALALEKSALLQDTYYEDVDGLWKFTPERLVESQDRGRRGQVLNSLFDDIARNKRPSCYSNNSFGHVYKPPRNSRPLPTVRSGSVGTNSMVGLQQKDIFGNHFNKQRAHIAPDSKSCSPSWGHAVEGALGRVEGNKKNEKRRLMIMGSDGQNGKDGFRFSPFNFIRFSSHDEYYDKAPHLMLLPIMTVDEIKDWDNNSYDVLVIASQFQDQLAEGVYRSVIHGDAGIQCTPQEISKATTSLRAFMKGLAASLLQEVPIQLASLANNQDKKDELDAVRKLVEKDGLMLPCFEVNQHIKPVLKLQFCASDASTAIADPWMLMAKAAVNVSWSRGQKLLPTCRPSSAENEEDHVFWQNMAEFEMAQRRSLIPASVSIPLTQATPNNVGKTGGAPVITPEKGGENWEFMDD
jgi:hypothetical protein